MPSRTEAGRVITAISPAMNYQKKRPTFQSPSRLIHGAFDPQKRVGQQFDLIGCDFSIGRLQDGGGGPLFTIRFPDGFTTEEATEEEVFEDGGWNP